MRPALLSGALLSLFLAGCGTDSPYGQYFTLVRQTLRGSLHASTVTRDQAAAIPYASIGYRVNGGDENLLVLATDAGGVQMWTAASHVVLQIRDGRVTRTLGLPYNLAGTSWRSDPPPPAAALKGQTPNTRIIDLPDQGAYSLPLTCVAAAAGPQTITILGAAIATTRIDEHCAAQGLAWSFTDSYWVDRQTGLVWRARQHIHPKLTLETEILRPPG